MTSKIALFERNGWRLTSYGNGMAYLLEDTTRNASVLFQGDDAFAFRQHVFCGEWLPDNAEERFADYSDILQEREPKPRRVAWDVEYTDTFGGEANYCWVKRARLIVPEGTSERAIMRKAKAEIGITGMRGRTYWHGDGGEFRPYRCCTVLFVTFDAMGLTEDEEQL